MFGRADCPVVETAEAELRQLAEGDPQGKRSAAIMPAAGLNARIVLKILELNLRENVCRPKVRKIDLDGGTVR